MKQLKKQRSSKTENKWLRKFAAAEYVRLFPDHGDIDSDRDHFHAFITAFIEVCIRNPQLFVPYHCATLLKEMPLTLLHGTIDSIMETYRQPGIETLSIVKAIFTSDQDCTRDELFQLCCDTDANELKRALTPITQQEIQQYVEYTNSIRTLRNECVANAITDLICDEMQLYGNVLDFAGLSYRIVHVESSTFRAYGRQRARLLVTGRMVGAPGIAITVPFSSYAAFRAFIKQEAVSIEYYPQDENEEGNDTCP